jgi:hypothetical protein
MGIRSDRRGPLTLKQLKRRGNRRMAEAQQTVAAARRIPNATEKLLARVKQDDLGAVEEQ